MKINKNELLNILKQLSPALDRKGGVNQSSSFLFDGEGIYTNNDRIVIYHSFASEIKGGIEGLKLIKLLDKFPGEELDYSIEEKQVVFKAGRTKAGIKLEKDIKLNKIDYEPVNTEWLNLGQNIVSAIKASLFCVSQNLIKPSLACLNLDGAFIYACDNFRAIKHRLDLPIESPFLLNGDAAKQLIKFIPLAYRQDDSWIHFRMSDGVYFSARKIEDEYPNVDGLFNKEGKKFKFPDIKEAIERTEIFSDEVIDKDKFIDLTFKDKKLLLKGEDETGWIEEEFDLDSDEELSLKINPIFFRDIIDHTKDVIINENSIFFECEDFDHIIALTQ